MNTIKHIQEIDFEDVIVAHNGRLGATAIIAIHSTTLGPAVGGTRMRRTSNVEEAMAEVLQLARSMSYKAAGAGLRFGGGKAFLIPPKTLDPHDEADPRRPDLFRWFGEVVESLEGRYVTTVDSGTFPSDMDAIRSTTEYVLGQPTEHGGSGDPSPKTARGVRCSFEAISETVLLKRTEAMTVNVQGAGHVGMCVIGELLDTGAMVRVADVRQEVVDQALDTFGHRITIVSPDSILQIPADVFCPCALGGVITPDNVKDLPFSAIVGAANNQIHGRSTRRALHEAGIYAVPDFIANAGGLIAVCGEYVGMPEAMVWDSVERIKLTVESIATHHAATNYSPYEIAEVWVEEALERPTRPWDRQAVQPRRQIG
jgi:glutamate dehydrogenase/leucine dehydrogenase